MYKHISTYRKKRTCIFSW